jgi:hypothetical protein
MGGKFSEAMKIARSSRVDSEETVNTDLQQSVNTDLQHLGSLDDPLVSLTIKVPKSLRQHWQIETKKANTTVTQEIITFLSNRFGKP